MTEGGDHRMTDIEHCETCGQPVREWSGKRNDLIGLSSMWAKRAHAAEAEAKSLRAALRAVLDKHGDECGVCVDAEHAIPPASSGGQ
jgi:hypothetical protein